MSENDKNVKSLNEILDKVFEYIDWLKEYEQETDETRKRLLCLRYSTEVFTFLLETKNKCENYFSTVVDQHIYLTQDYLRLRKFLIHWYTAFLCFIRQEVNISDINIIDKELFLRSLGYILVSEHGELGQKFLMTELADMYAQKGSPLSIAKALASLDVNNYTIFEYWLAIESGDYVFKPIPISDLNFDTGLKIEAKTVKPYESVVEKDPHWYLKREEIDEILSTEEIGLPSMTPYIGVISALDWLKFSRLVIAYTNKIVRKTLQSILNIPNYNKEIDRKYYFNLVGRTVSLAEIYLAINYTYGKLFNRNNLPPRDLENDEVYHYNKDIVSEVLVVTEYNEVFKKVYDRDEKDQIMQKIKDEWLTKNIITALTFNELEVLLENIASDIKNLCDALIDANEGLALLKQLLLMFDFYIKKDLGITGFSSIFILFDPLQENKEKLNKVFDFFKPYQTRLIELVTYMLINDIPGDCFATKNVLKQVIYQKLYEEYNKLLDILKQRIFQKIHIDVSRPGCQNLFCDILNQIIKQRLFEIYVPYDNRFIKINIQNVFVEIYTLYKDMFSYTFKFAIDAMRMGFNEHKSGQNPIPSFVVFNVYIDRIINIFKSLITCYDGFFDFRILRNKFDVFLRNIYESLNSKIINFLPKDRIAFNERKSTDDPIASALMFEIPFENVIEKNVFNLNFNQEDKNSELLFFVNRYVLYKDNFEYLVDTNLLVFDINEWVWDSESGRYLLEFTKTKDANIPEVFIEILNTQNISVNVNFIYDFENEKVFLSSMIPFSGTIIFLKYDLKIDIPYSFWIYNNQKDIYEFYINPENYGLEPDKEYIVSVLNENNEEVKVMIEYHEDKTFTIYSKEIFDAKILLKVTDFVEEFDIDDWGHLNNDFVLTCPRYNNLNGDAFEYCVFVIKENGEEVNLNIRYRYDGKFDLISRHKFKGRVFFAR